MISLKKRSGVMLLAVIIPVLPWTQRAGHLGLCIGQISCSLLPCRLMMPPLFQLVFLLQHGLLFQWQFFLFFPVMGLAPCYGGIPGFINSWHRYIQWGVISLPAASSIHMSLEALTKISIQRTWSADNIYVATLKELSCVLANVSTYLLMSSA